MSIQDLFFIAILAVLLIKQRYEWLVVAGLACVVISIPLFYFWIFFTAQKLIYYSAAFFLVAAILFIIKKR